MVANEQARSNRILTTLKAWLRLGIGLALAGLGLWLVTRNVAWGELSTTLRTARWGYAAVGLLVIALTIGVKAWRWQLLFYPAAEAPPYGRVLKALILGYFLNQLLPFARLGDIARIFMLGEDVRKGQVLGTLVVEKVLDMVMLGLTLFLLVPLITLPDVVSDPVTLALVALVALGTLYLLAYQTALVVRLIRRVAAVLPPALERRVIQLVVAGLDGLAALRDKRAAFSLWLISLLITVLSFLTPFVLFPMFDLNLGMAAAALLNVTLLVGSLPSSVPGSIGIFEALTILTLKWLGVEGDSRLLSYAVIYHLVVVLPVIFGGSWLAMRGEWRLSALSARR